MQEASAGSRCRKPVQEASAGRRCRKPVREAGAGGAGREWVAKEAQGASEANSRSCQGRELDSQRENGETTEKRGRPTGRSNGARPSVCRRNTRKGDQANGEIRRTARSGERREQADRGGGGPGTGMVSAGDSRESVEPEDLQRAAAADVKL